MLSSILFPKYEIGNKNYKLATMPNDPLIFSHFLPSVVWVKKKILMVKIKLIVGVFLQDFLFNSIYDVAD